MKFTYYTIIGKNLDLFRCHYFNVMSYAGLRSQDHEFLVIIYKNKSIDPKVTDSIIEFCNEMGIRYHVYEEPEGSSFLDNLYKCWGLGYEKARGEYVFRAGSDQAFCKDFFHHMFKYAGEHVLQANTIENSKRLREMNTYSRHFMEYLGDDFSNLNYEKFEALCDQIRSMVPKEIELLDIEQCLQYWRRPTEFINSKGVKNRTDGCSWLMKREYYERFGPMVPITRGISGDVTFLDAIEDAGVKDYLVKNALTFHFVQGSG